MANVEIFAINNETKDIDLVSEIPGAWGFGMLFWTKMEQKFLPPYDPKNENITRFVGSMKAFLHPEQPNPMQEVWDLEWHNEVPRELRLIMKSTLDNSYIPYDFIPEMADIIDNCEFATPVFHKIAESMKQIYENEKESNLLGICFNLTSVVSMEECYDKEKLWNIFDLIDIPTIQINDDYLCIIPKDKNNKIEE